MSMKLTRARIALFKGMRSDAGRMLDEYMAEQAGDQNVPRSPAIAWLKAQTEQHREQRIEKLKALVLDDHNQNDPYIQMTRAYLRQENNYQTQLNPEKRPVKRKPFWQRALFGVTLWKILLFMILGAVATFIVFSAMNWVDLNNSTQPALDANGLSPVSTDNTGPVASGIQLPDNSQSFAAGTYTATYPQGMIEFVAYEDASERVVDVQQMALLHPVDGGRYYALKVTFECRSGICNTPPEADVLLKMADETVMTATPNVGLAGEKLLGRIAQGRSTTGWLIFEIPQAAQVSAVVVWPRAEAGSSVRPEPIRIDLR